MSVQPVSLLYPPKNYLKIDNVVSRSAQPRKENWAWLKEQGVTDVFNFRTMYVSGVDFDEKTEVEALGMKYHNIPSVTRHPKAENVDRFLKEIEEVAAKGGKAHIHCKAGADRTGMYSYIYKSVKGIGDRLQNQREMISMGHNRALYPKLLSWTNELINKLLRAK